MGAPSHQLCRRLAALAAVLPAAFGLMARAAEGPWAKNFSLPEYQPPPNQTRFKSLLTADEFQVQGDGKYHLHGLRFQTYGSGADTNAEMVLRAPDGIYDRAQRAASSSGALKIETGDGKLQIEGEGFLFNEENSSLTLSNRVHTVIRRDALSQAVRNNPSAATAQAIQINSGHFYYDHDANVITYTDNVRAVDEQMEVICGLITVHLRADRSIEDIVADRDVVIVSRTSGSRATGDRAVYLPGEGQPIVELTGNPRWEDGASTGTGRRFRFDRGHNTLRVEGDAWLKLPRGALGQSGLLFAGQGQPAANTAGTNADKFVEIYSGGMLFQMPPTNGPVQQVTAETNVVILDPERNGRATGDRAVYTAATGVLELSGNAIWQSEDRLARGGILIFDRNQKSFTARMNAYLKFPALALGPLVAHGDAAAKAGPHTNLFVQALADSYDYRDDVLTFHDQVHVAVAEGDSIRATLDSARLQATFRSNQLQSLVAEKSVYAHQLPVPGTAGETLERDVKCDRFVIELGANGAVRSMSATGGVAATQLDTRPGGAPIRMALDAESVLAQFLPGTNRIESIVAERKVVLTRNDLKAAGDRAIYTGTDDVMHLIGNADVSGPGRQWLAHDLTLEHATDRTPGDVRGHNNVIKLQYTPRNQPGTNGPAPPFSLRRKPGAE